MQEYDRLKKDWEILRYLFLFLYYIYAQNLQISWFQDSLTFHLFIYCEAVTFFLFCSAYFYLPHGNTSKDSLVQRWPDFQSSREVQAWAGKEAVPFRFSLMHEL